MQCLEIWNNVAPAEVEAYRLIIVNILISLDNSNESICHSRGKSDYRGKYSLIGTFNSM